MYPLATLFPSVRDKSLPFTRDQVMLILMAVMQIGMGVEAYTGHIISGTIVPGEWIPIVFGPLAGLCLIGAGLLSTRNRRLATLLATITAITSIIVGLLGTYFHLLRAFLPDAPKGLQISLDRLIWAPPFIAPLMFALIGVLSLSAVWEEDPPDSGKLLFNSKSFQMPYKKTSLFFFWTGLAMLATVVSSVLDHARADFGNPWLWVPTIAGVFATFVTLGLGLIKHHSKTDLGIYFVCLCVLLVIGPIGSFLHIQADLTAGGDIVGERLLRGAPVMAPLLFSNMALLGLVVLLNPRKISKN